MTTDGKRALVLLRQIVAATHSHVDGRDLLAELHPRKTLDIKRRSDGVETWFEGDWLTNVQREVDRAKAFLFSLEIAGKHAAPAGRNPEGEHLSQQEQAG